MAVQRAFLLIADIGGYTRFMNVNRTNLAHAQEIVGDLLEAVLEGASRNWTLAKLEGDAAFFYSVVPDSGESDRDLAHEAARIRAAFLRRKTEITLDSPCTCEGCDQASALKLKFAAHTGEIAIQKVKRYRELAGVDVILVHRMLKNSVPIDEYVLLTQPAAQTVAPDLHAKLQRVDEDFAGIGPTVAHYLDLTALAQEAYVVEPNLLRRSLHMLRYFFKTLPYWLRLKSPTCEGFRNLSRDIGGVLPRTEPQRELPH